MKHCTEKSKIFCKNCINCKIKNNLVSCKNGYFCNVTLKEAYLYKPFDFDCVEFEEI
jgi:hypothetical protein